MFEIPFALSSFEDAWIYKQIFGKILQRVFFGERLHNNRDLQQKQKIQMLMKCHGVVPKDEG